MKVRKEPASWLLGCGILYSFPVREEVALCHYEVTEREFWKRIGILVGIREQCYLGTITQGCVVG